MLPFQHFTVLLGYEPDLLNFGGSHNKGLKKNTKSNKKYFEWKENSGEIAVTKTTIMRGKHFIPFDQKWSADSK